MLDFLIFIKILIIMDFNFFFNDMNTIAISEEKNSKKLSVYNSETYLIGCRSINQQLCIIIFAKLFLLDELMINSIMKIFQ